MRLVAECAYDGTNFHGWAKQPNLRTVQGCIIEACATAMRLSQDELSQFQIVVAGRTDTGVHARHQIFHCDVDESWLQRCMGHLATTGVAALEHRLRHLLPDDISLLRLEIAENSFDARFSALSRTYVYRIDDLGLHDPRLRSCVLRVKQPLNVELMNRAALKCIGLHDFGSFATPNPGGTTIREVKQAVWRRIDNVPLTGVDEAGVSTLESGLLCFTIVADAFAHNMVRSLVQGCIQVGLEKKTLDWFAEKIAVPKREGSTGPAPALGLTLEHIAYPSPEEFAQRAEQIRAKRTLDSNENLH